MQYTHETKIYAVQAKMPTLSTHVNGLYFKDSNTKGIENNWGIPRANMISIFLG